MGFDDEECKVNTSGTGLRFDHNLGLDIITFGNWVLMANVKKHWKNLK